MKQENPSNPESELKTRQENTQNSVRFEAIAEQAGIRMGIEMIPAQGEVVTGDFYRVLRLNDGRLSIFVGDVVHHGPSAAEVSLELHNFMETTAFQQCYTEEAQASDILKYIDEHMPVQKEAATLAHILLNPETGQLQYANAGMPYLLICKRNGEISELESQGMFIGLDYRQYNSGTVFAQLSKGDTVILMSDGVFEATVRNGGTIDDVKEYLRTALREIGDIPNQPEELAQRTISQLASSRLDDATILIFQLPIR